MSYTSYYEYATPEDLEQLKDELLNEVEKLKKEVDALSTKAKNITRIVNKTTQYITQSEGSGGGGGGASVSDASYSAAWNGVTDVAPSANAVYDALASTNSSLSSLTTTVNGHTTTIGQHSTTLGTHSTDISNLFNNVSNKANILSPALTGTPTAPTAAVGTNNSQIATTAFVRSELDDVATHVTLDEYVDNGIRLFTDFIGRHGAGVHPFSSTGMNGGGVNETAGTAVRPGVIRINAHSTNGSSGARLNCGETAIKLSGGERFIMGALVPPVATRMLRAGFIHLVGTSVPADAAYFEVWGTTLTAYTRVSGAVSNLGSVTIGNIWLNFVLTVNEDASVVNYKVVEADTGAVVLDVNATGSQIPTGTLGCSIAVHSTDGTSEALLYLDYAGLYLKPLGRTLHV